MKAFLTPVTACLAIAFLAHIASAESPSLSAKEIASKMSDARQDGHSYVRARMEIKTKTGESKAILQLAIKSRRTDSSTDVLYQILFPKERKGEALWLRQQANGNVNGSISEPPTAPRGLGASDMKQSLFGGNLSLEDVVDNFFGWDSQTITGTETIDGVSCQIIESKPGSTRSSYSSVRSWVDTKRMVPLRVEKYISGSLARRLDATRVVAEDGRQIVATLVITQPGVETTTEIEGSRIRRDVTYSDSDFTAAPVKSGE